MSDSDFLVTINDEIVTITFPVLKRDETIKVLKLDEIDRRFGTRFNVIKNGKTIAKNVPLILIRTREFGVQIVNDYAHRSLGALSEIDSIQKVS